MKTFLWVQLWAIFLLYIVRSTNALFEHCNNTYTFSSPNRIYYLNSPYYPEKYPEDTSCIYIFNVPQDYEIVADCDISLPKGENSCTTDYFYISKNGDQSLNGAGQYCGSGKLTRTSLFNEMALAYISTRNSPGGRFNCKLRTRLQACDCGWSGETKILGGVPTAQYEFPSIVSLRLRSTNDHYCAGTIINHRYIATAAHCTRFFESPQNIHILVGYNANRTAESSSSQFSRIYEAEEFIEYPQYNWITNDNDIALVRTKKSIEWSRAIGPICLPLDQLHDQFDYTNVSIVGWGTTFFAGRLSNNLRTTTVRIIPNSECQERTPLLQPSQLCTFYPQRDACQRDSGGPVVFKGPIREYLLGIISKGNACGIGPGINTRITSFLQWIYQITNGSLCFKPYTSTE